MTSPTGKADVPRPFSVQALGAPDGVGVLVLAGEADMAAAESFRTAVDDALDGGARTLVLDLADVPFMDSTMLRELLRVQGALTERSGAAVLAAPQSAVLRLLTLTRTSDLFRIVDDRAHALADSA